MGDCSDALHILYIFCTLHQRMCGVCAEIGAFIASQIGFIV